MHATDLAVDLRLGVRTRGLSNNEAALGPLSLEKDPHGYEPIHADWWRRSMSVLPPMPAGTTFVDLGAGRGRAMVLAARMGFQRIVGVELDPRLAETAARNVHRWSKRAGSRGRASAAMAVVRADAATYSLPAGPLLIFMANPFGPETMRQVLQQVVSRAGDGDDVLIVYFNPVHVRVLEEHSELELYHRGADWVVYQLVGAAGAALGSRPSSPP